jgi:hypothetical protein
LVYPHPTMPLTNILPAIRHGRAREACDILLNHDEEGMRRAIALLMADG